MSTARDEALMARALEVASRGRPSPNPHVGALVVTPDGVVLAEGHHARAGADHAEVHAIRRSQETVGMTLYVTMEPCNHHGRTPPCTEAVIAAGFRRVVVGCSDPAPHVPGAMARLRDAGIEVRSGVLGAQCQARIADFAKHIRTGLPYVTLKAAVTLDGKMCTRTGNSAWITGALAREEVHRMRDRSDAIAVGVGTVIADDPMLTVRHVEGEDPQRIVLDTHLRTPPRAKVLPALVFHGPGVSAERRRALRNAGAELVEVAAHGTRLELEAVLRAIASRGVVRLMVEGGATLHGALLEASHADTLAIFVAPVVLGDSDAPSLAASSRPILRIADAWRIREPRVRMLGADVLFEGPIEGGPP